MLEQYIKNFAHQYLELKKEYLDYIKTDDGVYSVEINDTLVCTIEDFSFEKPGFFALTVALGNGESAEDLVKKIVQWTSRLRITPWNGLAKIIVSHDDLTAGLYTEFDCSALLVEPSLFNQWLHSFMSCSYYLIDESHNLESIPSLVTKQQNTHYLNLLESLNLDENKIEEQLNIIDLDDEFSSLVEYNPSTDHLLFLNSFDFKGSADTVLELLEQNSSLPQSISFNYEKNVFFILQSLNLKDTDSQKFWRAISIQKKICSEITSLFEDSSFNRNEKQEVSFLSAHSMFV